MSTRRSFVKLIGLAGLVGASYGAVAALRRLTAPDFTYEPVAGLPGFRRVAGGPVSGGATPLVGLGAPSAPVPDIPDFCAALFGPDRPAGAVPIAYFTDMRCVNCRTVSPILARMTEDPGLHITWHEWPILGPASARGARAALAARNQGAYQVFHERLMGSPILPGDRYIARLAADAGIDSDRLFADMSDPAIDRQLAITAALATRFGFVGTPALVVGRTAYVGRLDAPTLERLIATERSDRAQMPCPADQ